MVYDLWPLQWWQNPWIWSGVGGTITAISLVVWYIVRRRRKSAFVRTPRACLLQRLYSLRSYIDSASVDSKYVYTELIYIVRDCCHLLFMIRVDSATDEELVTMLRNHEYANIPERFLVLAEGISDASCYAKFAAQSISREQIIAHISDSISFLEAHDERETLPVANIRSS